MPVQLYYGTRDRGAVCGRCGKDHLEFAQPHLDSVGRVCEPDPARGQTASDVGTPKVQVTHTPILGVNENAPYPPPGFAPPPPATPVGFIDPGPVNRAEVAGLPNTGDAFDPTLPPADTNQIVQSTPTDENGLAHTATDTHVEASNLGAAQLPSPGAASAPFDPRVQGIKGVQDAAGDPRSNPDGPGFPGEAAASASSAAQQAPVEPATFQPPEPGAPHTTPGAPRNPLDSTATEAASLPPRPIPMSTGDAQFGNTPAQSQRISEQFLASQGHPNAPAGEPGTIAFGEAAQQQ
jgi:hypothetical protein